MPYENALYGHNIMFGESDGIKIIPPGKMMDPDFMIPIEPLLPEHAIEIAKFPYGIDIAKDLSIQIPDGVHVPI